MHHKNLLTIKDTLLSSQTSHPHNNPHTTIPTHNHAETITRRPDQPYHTNPETTKPQSRKPTSRTSHHPEPLKPLQAAPDGPPNITHTPPPTQIQLRWPSSLPWRTSPHIESPGPLASRPGQIMLKITQRIRAPTVFFPRRTKATRPQRKSSSVKR